jgi:hypothetical protein
MHQKGHRTQNTGGMANQLDEFASGCPAPQVDYSGQRRVVMSSFAHLDKIYATFKVIHHVLPSAPVPPFDAEIVFSTRANNPTGFAGLQLFGQGRRARFFLRAQMDVTVKCGGFKPEVQLSAQVPDIAVDKMVGKLIALMNQRIMTLHGSRFRIVIGDAREERVVLP